MTKIAIMLFLLYCLLLIHLMTVAPQCLTYKIPSSRLGIDTNPSFIQVTSLYKWIVLCQRGHGSCGDHLGKQLKVPQISVRDTFLLTRYKKKKGSIFKCVCVCVCLCVREKAV